jgi:PhzF family phenazine biosynthesis protein
MKQKIYQVDAFADRLFEGNPAAVCPLDEWLPDGKLQQIAMENNLSETAYFVDEDDGYRLRWFTPAAEVDLCGHATLASAHVLFEHLDYRNPEITFNSNSGPLKVRKDSGMLVMNFPTSVWEEADPPEELMDALGTGAEEVYRASDYMVVLESEEQVRNLDPNFFLLNRIETRGVIVTAPGEQYDFVSRFFAPAVGINEDPVTGSAHTMLAPYWSERLGKDELKARQVSNRGGTVYCRMLADRVEIAGKAVTYLE